MHHESQEDGLPEVPPPRAGNKRRVLRVETRPPRHNKVDAGLCSEGGVATVCGYIVPWHNGYLLAVAR